MSEPTLIMFFAITVIPISLFFIIMSLLFLFKYNKTYKPGTFGFYIYLENKARQCFIEAVLDDKYIVREVDNSINMIDKYLFVPRRKLTTQILYDRNGHSIEV